MQGKITIRKSKKEKNKEDSNLKTLRKLPDCFEAFINYINMYFII